MGKLGFGELELAILKIVKERGRATVRDVYEALGSEGSYTTVMTVMSRLADKGSLEREKEGKQFVYWMGSEKEGSAAQILHRIQERLFSGNSAAMVSYLLDAGSEISDKELAEIESLIQQKRAKKANG